MELNINGQVYKFAFNMGFMREINKRVSVPVDGIKDEKRNIGFNYKVTGVIEGDIEDLCEVLDCANKTFEPRVTKELLDDLIDNETTDIDKLFNDVIEGLKNANATHKAMKNTLEEYEILKAQQKAKMEQMI